MFRTFSIAALILGLGGTTAALAQSESETPDNGLALGETVEEELQVGETYRVEVFTDWEKRCVRAADGNDPCQLYQLLFDQNDNAVAEITLFPLPAGGQAVAGGTIITPLETLLPAQLRIQVDGGETRRYPFAFCSTIGCFARIGLTQPEVDAFRAGNSATITINPAAAPDETVALTVSLSGFTAGFANLQADQAAAAGE